jgi:hypothetical protein
MSQPSAASAVQALLNRQRDLLCAIALADEEQARRRQELAEVRAQLHGVQLGHQLVTQKEPQTDG